MFLLLYSLAPVRGVQIRPGVFDEDFSQCAVGEMLNSDSFFSAEQRKDIRLCVDSFLQHINLCIYRCINGTCG